MENTKTKLIVTMAQIAVNVQNAVKYANFIIDFSFIWKIVTIFATKTNNKRYNYDIILAFL